MGLLIFPFEGKVDRQMAGNDAAGREQPGLRRPHRQSQRHPFTAVLRLKLPQQSWRQMTKARPHYRGLQSSAQTSAWPWRDAPPGSLQRSLACLIVNMLLLNFLIQSKEQSNCRVWLLFLHVWNSTRSYFRPHTVTWWLISLFWKGNIWSFTVTLVNNVITPVGLWAGRPQNPSRRNFRRNQRASGASVQNQHIKSERAFVAYSAIGKP